MPAPAQMLGSGDASIRAAGSRQRTSPSVAAELLGEFGDLIAQLLDLEMGDPQFEEPGEDEGRVHRR
jgi:hypothetical protein